MKHLHRFALNGKAVCGVETRLFSIHGCSVTCPECLILSKPLTPEQALQLIRNAADARQADKR